MSVIRKKTFNCFDVYSSEDDHSVVHVDITNTPSFYQNMFDYFFNETRFLKYIENKTSLSFEPTVENYVSLYKRLSLYVDDENIHKLPTDIEDEVLKILAEEYTLEDKGNGNFEVRLDKIGKIGEYIFCNLLSEYFGFSCVIPKANLITDRNMSVFGIDAVFYCPEDKMILFGESKVSNSLQNGVALINKSLSTYQQQVDEEFVLILSQRWLRDKMGVFAADFGSAIDRSTTMKDFISKARVKSIGIPLFIAHGTETNTAAILSKLSSIRKVKLYNLETKIISISLPILCKSKLVATFTQKIVERRKYYESTI